MSFCITEGFFEEEEKFWKFLFDLGQALSARRLYIKINRCFSTSLLDIYKKNCVNINDIFAADLT